MESTPPYSTHSFMLPIKWDYLPKGYGKGRKNELDYDTRTDLSKMNEFLTSSLFERSFYKVECNVSKYNELAYFHAYVVNNLFDLQQSDEPTVSHVSKSKNVCFYTISTVGPCFYKIKTVTKNFVLDLDSISLHVFNTGITILTFNCLNIVHRTKEDVLLINEYGRRFYPAFLVNGNRPIGAVKDSFLADEVLIDLSEKGVFADDFEAYNELTALETHQYENGKYQLNKVIQLPKFIKGLFSEKFVFALGDEKGDCIRLNIIGDDRMYFQSWIGDKDLASSLTSDIHPEPQYKESNYWFALLNGDKSKNNVGIANKKLLAELNAERTYDLWLEYGTLFGFTRDSFCAVSDDSEFSHSTLKVHMQSLYYQMAVLCLAQRSSVLRFATEISSLADLGKTSPELASDRIKSLYLNYIEFINKLYFREVTPQMQGIDIYTRMQNAMNINNDIKDLANELSELNNFSMMIKQDLQNKNSVRLSQVATIFLPASLLFGVLGANFYSNTSWIIFDKSSNITNNLIWIFIGLLPSLVVAGYYYLKNKNKK